ncbi:hypothetical protein BV898_02171 [Hypsibius exemplaris]|uniref:Gustatory receptor n=1 Tax=Hypsibius exemplaris TaxID=2072580 RepID=A0A1W0X8G6_HYPEX|nr:hypothetical protein BV898_02171 [Hypsibius exemplaris]
MRSMQLHWNTVPRTITQNYATRKVEISPQIRIFPSYPILFYFYMIPRVDLAHNVPSRFHNTSLFRMLITLFTLVFLFLVLVHDVIYFFMDKDFWTKYFANGSRIITLLLSIRTILIFWKNGASTFLFLWKSRYLHRYLVELNAMVLQIPMAPKMEKRHRATFMVVFSFPFVLMALRVAASIYSLTLTRADRMVNFGFIRAPLWARMFFYHFAEIIGGNNNINKFLGIWEIFLFPGILCIASYVQVAVFTSLLRRGCAHLNARLTTLYLRLKEEKDLPSSTFQAEVQSLRDFHELLIDLCNKHEGLFSLQILVAILNNSFVVFSSLASFFTPGVSQAAIGIYLISIIAFVYAILLLPFFHIQLSEESGKTIEIFQDVVHKRSQTTHRPIDEFILLTYFLQRAMTKPLVVTAGGFMELTRSFVVTIGAVVLGFALFLMERVEGAAASTPEAIPCLRQSYNATESWLTTTTAT